MRSYGLQIVALLGLLTLIAAPADTAPRNLSEGSAVVPSVDLPTLWRNSDAVVHLKIIGSAAERTLSGGACERFYKYEAKVFEPFRLHLGGPKTTAAVLRPAEPCADVMGLDPVYKNGDEFIAFLRWHEAGDAFLGFVMVPVRNGQAKSPHVQGIESGIKLEAFLVQLRAMME